MDIVLFAVAIIFGIASFVFFLASMDAPKDEIYKVAFFGLVLALWATISFFGALNIKNRDHSYNLHVQCAHKDGIFHKDRCFKKDSEIKLVQEKK